MRSLRRRPQGMGLGIGHLPHDYRGANGGSKFRRGPTRKMAGALLFECTLPIKIPSWSYRGLTLGNIIEVPLVLQSSLVFFLRGVPMVENPGGNNWLLGEASTEPNFLLAALPPTFRAATISVSRLPPSCLSHFLVTVPFGTHAACRTSALSRSVSVRHIFCVNNFRQCRAVVLSIFDQSFTCNF